MGAKESERSWEDYLSVTCLRNTGTLGGRLLANQIYVHSKLLIVDDRCVVCGSANINDRSQEGERDSEVCLLVGDLDMDQGDDQGNAFAGSLQQFCMAEHLGMLEGGHPEWGAGSHPDISEAVSEQLKDMTSDATWALWCGTAKHNTNLYNQGFPSQPCNQLESIKQWKELTELEKVSSDKGYALMREHPSNPHAKYPSIPASIPASQQAHEVEPARISKL